MEEIIIPEHLRGPLFKILERGIIIKEEGYKCGQCAAFPCFRMPSSEERGALCFQAVRQCRQECKFYSYSEYPAEGGICRKDGRKVNYTQACHVPEMRVQRNQQQIWEV